MHELTRRIDSQQLHPASATSLRNYLSLSLLHTVVILDTHRYMSNWLWAQNNQRSTTTGEKKPSHTRKLYRRNIRYWNTCYLPVRKTDSKHRKVSQVEGKWNSTKTLLSLNSLPYPTSPFTRGYDVLAAIRCGRRVFYERSENSITCLYAIFFCFSLALES